MHAYASPRAVATAILLSALTPALGNPPTIIMGPGELTMAHKTDEFCFVHRLAEAVEAYVEIAESWCI